MLTSAIIAMTNVDLVLIFAIVLFCIAGMIRAKATVFDNALIAFGLALFALAFIINP